MSGGKTPSQTTTTTKQEPPSWAVPQYQNLLNQASQLASRPYQGYTGPTVASFNQDQQTAQNMVRQQAMSGQLDDAASNYTQGLLQGQGAYTPAVNPYAGENPYLNRMIDNAQADVTRAYSNTVQPNIMAQFNNSGAYGGTAHQSMLGESQRQLAGELGNISTGLRSQDYDRQVALSESDINRRMQAANDFQSRQLQALALAPQTQQLGYADANALFQSGQQRQALDQEIFDSAYGQWLEQRDWTPNQLGILGSALGSINGGFQSGSVTAPNLNRPNPWMGAASGAAAGAAMGSVIPVVGTGVGALIGAGLGYFGSR